MNKLPSSNIRHLTNNLVAEKHSRSVALQKEKGRFWHFFGAILSKQSLILNILLLGELMFFIDGAIYLEQINCTISYLVLIFFYFGFCLIYFASSLKNSCRDGSWSEAFLI